MICLLFIYFTCILALAVYSVCLNGSSAEHKEHEVTTVRGVTLVTVVSTLMHMLILKLLTHWRCSECLSLLHGTI